jgi:hypothetical protein
MTLHSSLHGSLNSPVRRLRSTLRRDRDARRLDLAALETKWFWKLLVRIRPDRPPSST